MRVRRWSSRSRDSMVTAPRIRFLFEHEEPAMKLYSRAKKIKRGTLYRKTHCRLIVQRVILDSNSAKTCVAQTLPRQAMSAATSSVLELNAVERHEPSKMILSMSFLDAENRLRPPLPAAGIFGNRRCSH